MTPQSWSWRPSRVNLKASVPTLDSAGFPESGRVSDVQVQARQWWSLTCMATQIPTPLCQLSWYAPFDAALEAGL